MAGIGKIIEVPRNDEMGLTSLSLTSEDLAILISYSGQIVQFPHHLLEHLSDCDVTTLAITSQEKSPLAQFCDFTLPISGREQIVGKNFRLLLQKSQSYSFSISSTQLIFH